MHGKDDTFILVSHIVFVTFLDQIASFNANADSL